MKKDIIKEINNISLPAVILIASIILGGFYYASQVNKQRSIEKQQENALLEEQRIRDEQSYKESSEKLNRMSCVIEAEQSATKQYKETCIYDCQEGYYYTSNYENYYKTCLQRKGLSY